MRQRTTPIGAFIPWGLLLGGLWLAFAASVTAQSHSFTTIAGLAGVSRKPDGTNSTARFCRPSGIAAEGAGNVYYVLTNDVGPTSGFFRLRGNQGRGSA